MKTSAATFTVFVMLCGLAPQAAAQGSRPAATSASTAAAPAAAATPAASTDYRLVNGDKLRIEVYKDTQLSQSLQIRPDGKITLPLIGDMVAAGRTSAELRDSLAVAFKEYISNPVVTVIVVETVPQTIHVMGEVNTPGPQSIAGETSIIQALAAAGGFKLFANKKAIKVLRKGAAGVTTLTFNYNDAIKGEATILTLKAGDTVIVP